MNLMRDVRKWTCHVRLCKQEVTGWKKEFTGMQQEVTGWKHLSSGFWQLQRTPLDPVKFSFFNNN